MQGLFFSSKSLKIYSGFMVLILISSTWVSTTHFLKVILAIIFAHFMYFNTLVLETWVLKILIKIDVPGNIPTLRGAAPGEQQSKVCKIKTKIILSLGSAFNTMYCRTVDYSSVTLQANAFIAGETFEMTFEYINLLICFSAENMTAAQTVGFSAPLLTSWFCTLWTMLFFPIFIISNTLVSWCGVRSSQHVLADALHQFREAGISNGN